ncbi:MAG: hypothetical protein QXE05_11560 [Nitrososphaeria archaeon]
MKTSTIVIAIIGIAIIGYLVYRYVFSSSSVTTTTPTTTSTTTPTTTSTTTPTTTSTTTTSLQKSFLSNDNYIITPTGQLLTSRSQFLAYAQKLACKRYPQLCAKEAPYLSSEKKPVTTYSSSQSSIVHRSYPTIIPTGIGKYITPMGGPAINNWGSNTVNRNSYSYIQQIEKTNSPFMQKISAITTSTQPQKTISSSFTIKRPGLPTLSELKKQNPFLR